jgi:type IV secretion system protein VirB2
VTAQFDSSLSIATQWIAAALTGSVATAVATIAVAAIGFAFLQGRIDAGRAMRTLFGCFIIFGAPTISSALIGGSAQISLPSPPVDAREQVSTPAPQSIPYDPYAGASVPVR